jgi:hypothetical protein
MTQTKATVALLALAFSSPCLAQQAVQWRVEDGGNGHWYEFVRVAVHTTWPSARESCLASGGDLAIVSSQQLTSFLDALYPASTNACFIGGQFADGTWRWIDGRPVTWSNWCPCGQPSGDGPAVEIWSGGVWNDVSMSQPRQGYLAEWSADCNGDGIVDYGQCRDGSLGDINGNNVPDCCEGAQACCIGNLNGDAAVDGADLGILLNAWGTCAAPCAADLNRDGFVDGTDLGALLGNWGACP